MSFLRISLFLCCAFVVFVRGQPHSSLYGVCKPNRSSNAIYSEVFHIRNNGIAQKSPRTIRRWMNSVRDMFRIRNSISTTISPALNSVRISQLITYPSQVSIRNRKSHSGVSHCEHLCAFCRESVTYIRSRAFKSSIKS